MAHVWGERGGRRERGTEREGEKQKCAISVIVKINQRITFIKNLNFFVISFNNIETCLFVGGGGHCG